MDVAIHYLRTNSKLLSSSLGHHRLITVHYCFQELFGTEGVDVAIHYLRTNSKLLSSGLGHHRLLLSSVDSVWCSIVGCYITEDYFLEKEGVFLLIDLLEVIKK